MGENKIMPEAESHKMTADQLIGRHVVIGRHYPTSRFVGQIGIVVTPRTAYPNVITVTWPNEICNHSWGLDDLYQVDVLEERPQISIKAILAAKERTPREIDTMMFFGPIDSSVHPLLKLRDSRKSK